MAAARRVEFSPTKSGLDSPLPPRQFYKAANSSLNPLSGEVEKDYEKYSRWPWKTQYYWKRTYQYLYFDLEICP
jgi:hypothetical protein